jgi:hypothetical protein
MENLLAPAVETTPRLATARRRWLFLVVLLWIAASIAGFWLLNDYAAKKGAAGNPLPQWPHESAIQLSAHGATLVIFAHPQCSCTRATLTELQRIMARCPNGLTPWIVFYQPDNAPAEWQHSSLLRSAEAIPGLHVMGDRNGAEAARFHAYTSGQAFLYNSQGNLLFSGGITGSRGHEGDNAGESAIEELVTAGTTGCRQAPVFGCPIETSSPPTTDNSF